jgi:hypothetical protein
MSFLASFESKKNIVFNLRFSVIPRICQSSVGRQSCHSLYIKVDRPVYEEEQFSSILKNEFRKAQFCRTPPSLENEPA